MPPKEPFNIEINYSAFIIKLIMEQFECRDCNLKFDKQEQLDNHKKKVSG